MITTLQRTINRPSISISAVVFAVWLGTMKFSFLKYLQPFGDFYIALLQMCVLPFLLATIPLAMRSALTSSTGGKVARRLVLWIIATFIVVAVIAIAVPATIFSILPFDQATSSRIGTLFGDAADHVDIELALNPDPAIRAGDAKVSGVLAFVPSNVFSALASNDSLRVIIFMVIFGSAMVLSERRSGISIFGALRHIQSVCIMIFDCFNLLVPIGIVALIAPQVALLGSDVYSVLASFAYAFLAASAILLAIPIFGVSISLRLHVRVVFAKLLTPIALGAATRNSLVCIPAAIETMTEELHTPQEPCELYIPIGFATMRFGTVVFFATAALFVGHLMGRTFSISELLLLAAFSIIGSFATIGVTGLAALAPLAAVLRPFGLSYELALPLMVIVEPIAAMVRVMLNVALNCQVPVLAAGWQAPPVTSVAVSAEELPA
jgi:proton glutamate symport protein